MSSYFNEESNIRFYLRFLKILLFPNPYEKEIISLSREINKK